MHGWQGLHRHRFPEIGYRWMSDVDVPDLDLFPQHYPELRRCASQPASRSACSTSGCGRRRGPRAPASCAAWPACCADAGHETAAVGARQRCRRHVRAGRWGRTGRAAHAHVAPRRAQRRWPLRPGHGVGDPCQAHRRRAAVRRPARALLRAVQLGEFEAEISDLDITCWLDGTEATRREPCSVCPTVGK